MYKRQVLEDDKGLVLHEAAAGRSLTSYDKVVVRTNHCTSSAELSKLLKLNEYLNF